MSGPHKQSVFVTPGKSLEWIQVSSFKKKYEFHSDTETVGTLYFPRTFSSEARGESSDGCWVFRQAGFWRSRIEIRECDHELPSAFYHHKKFRKTGILHLSKGRLLMFRMNIWGSKAEVATDKGEMILTLSLRGIIRDRGFIELHEKANVYPEIFLAVFLALYVTLLQRRRVHAAAG